MVLCLDAAVALPKKTSSFLLVILDHHTIILHPKDQRDRKTHLQNQGVPRNFTHNWQQLGKSLIHSDKAQVMAGTTNSLSGQPAPHHESLHSLRNRLYRIDCWCFWVLL